MRKKAGLWPPERLHGVAGASAVADLMQGTMTIAEPIEPAVAVAKPATAANRLVPLASPGASPRLIMVGKVTVAPLAAIVLMNPPARPQAIKAARVRGSIALKSSNCG